MELFKLLGTIAIEGADIANEQITKITEKAGDVANKLGVNLEKVGKTASKIGTKMSIGLTTPLTFIGKKAISAASDFESAMSEVAAISGATGRDFEALEQKAKEMGERTKFSASESAEALKYMAMAGWKTEDMLNGLEGIMNLAAASGEELGLTSDIVTDALTAFGLSASDSAHFADVLAAASSNANTNVSMMGETFKYIAPVAGSLGYSTEDTALAIGLMANSGIKAGQAGTALRSALTNLVNPTEDMAAAMINLGLMTEETANVIDNGKIMKAQQKVEDKTFALEKAQIKYNTAVEKYGVESSQAQTASVNLEKAQVELERAMAKLTETQMGEAECIGFNNQLLMDSAGNMKSLRDVIGTLREKFAGLTEEQQSQTAATLFGKEAMSGMLAIINASDTDLEKLAKSIDECEGSTKKMADTMNDNLTGQITLLKSQLEGLAIQFVTLVMPFLKDMVTWLSNLCTWISNLDDGSKKLVITIGAIIAAAGPILIFIGNVASGIGNIIKFIGLLSGGIGNLTPMVSGIAGLGSKLLGGIGSLATKIGSALIPALTAIGPVGWAIIGAITALVAAGVALYKNWDEVSQWASKAWGAIKEVVSGALESISNFLTKIFDFVKNNWQGLLLMIANPFVGAFKLIYDNCESFRNFIDGFLENIKDGFSNTWNSLKDAVSSAWEGIKEKTSQGMEAVKEVFSNGIEAAMSFKDKFLGGLTELKDKAAQKFQELKDSASQKVSELKETIVSKATELKDKASAAFSGIADKAVEGFNNLREKGSSAIEGLGSAFTNIFSSMWNTVVEKASAFAEKFSQPFENAKDKVRDIVSSIKEFFNFNWELPKIKLPHFNISYDTGGLLGGLATKIGLPGIPKFDVEWYKDGGIMTDPTAFGFNPYSGKVMAGGEAGPEAIAPISTLQSYVQEAVSESNYQLYQVLNQILALLIQYFPQLANKQLVLDTGALVGELAEPMNEELGKITYMRERWN